MRQLKRRKEQVRDTLRARELLTAIVLIVSLIVTYNLWETALHAEEEALQSTYDFRARESVERIQQRILVYEQVLRSAVGLFGATKTVSREGFQAFAEALRLAESYPGIQGIGFVALIPAADKGRHVAAIRKEGFPEYEIKPEGERAVYTSIVYLEPFSGNNLRAFGYDMYSEPNRRAAMDQARDTGKAAVSAKVTLVQEVGSEVQAGFLMYLPVYRNGTPHDTVSQRRANLIGWIYAPFRMNDFMRGLQGEYGGALDIEIYDDSVISDATKMYDEDSTVNRLDARRRFARISRIEAGNRIWTVATAALPASETKMSSDRPQLILQAGISISLMLALLIWLFLDDRARAFHAADQAMQLALYDPLTGLPNRKLLDERLGQSVTKAKRSHGHVALLFIDLDKFKPVNDNYGHAYGDLLLKEVAKRLQKCMRESDTASRLGGDEFVALLPEIDGKKAVMTVATKILTLLTHPYEIAGHTFEISASIGAAIYPDDGADEKALMKSADFAMYAAKNSGRGNVKFAHPDKESAAE